MNTAIESVIDNWKHIYEQHVGILDRVLSCLTSNTGSVAGTGCV